jgi:hypothetical protein
MVDGKLRVVTDDGGRRWVQAADVLEVRKLSLKALRILCPDVAHFEDEGRPVRWIPVDQTAAILVLRGVAAGDADARQTSYATATLTATGLRRHGLPRATLAVERGAELAVETTVDPEPAQSVSEANVDLVPIVVTGWGTMFRGGAAAWVRDLDVAEKAGLAVPRDIRRTIAKAIEDGAICSVGAAHATSEPAARIIEEVVAKGDRGGTQAVATFYLNEEAALLVLTRLRTPQAIKVTKAVVQAFAALMRGELSAVVSPAPSSDVAELKGMVREMLAALPAIVTAAVRAGASSTPSLPPPVSAPAPVQAQPVAVAAPAPPPVASPPPPPPPTMLIPRDWRSSDVLAALLTERRGHRVSRSIVDAAIASLKLRGKPSVARHGMTRKTDGGGVSYEVPFWRYAPSVLDELERHLFAKPAAQQTIPLDEG